MQLNKIYGFESEIKFILTENMWKRPKLLVQQQQ